MLIFELILLSIAYTSLAIALFLQVLCFMRKIESVEAIAFTLSLLLLVTSISISPMFQNENNTTISTLICMVLISSTTFFNTLNERKHSISPIYKTIHIFLALTLIVIIGINYWVDYLLYIQYATVGFLIFSIVSSMIIMRVTKPIKQYNHLEKSNRFFGIVFLALVPMYLIFLYGFDNEYEQIPIGFLLYVAFIMLALSKIFDDLKRLSLVKTSNIEPHKQHFKNYGLTAREEEITLLLLRGYTYKSISEELYISLPTVKTHTSNIYKKCKVKTRNELRYLVSV